MQHASKSASVKELLSNPTFLQRLEPLERWDLLRSQRGTVSTCAADQLHCAVTLRPHNLATNVMYENSTCIAGATCDNSPQCAAIRSYTATAWGISSKHHKEDLDCKGTQQCFANRICSAKKASNQCDGSEPHCDKQHTPCDTMSPVEQHAQLLSEVRLATPYMLTPPLSSIRS